MKFLAANVMHVDLSKSIGEVIDEISKMADTLMLIIAFEFAFNTSRFNRSGMKMNLEQGGRSLWSYSRIISPT